MTPIPELLSPAGDFTALRYALRYGADAVYLGAREFGMRTSSANFTDEEMAQATQLAHSMGKRVYLTMNTLPTNSEAARIPDMARRAAQAGIDAFIIADLGVLAMVKHALPDAEIHISTQMGVTNYAAASALYDMGASRVVLARELSLTDIRTIRDNTPQDLELEVFVHGAMCMSVSGRCMLSYYMAGRDANRGNCAQSCRWRYTLHEETRDGQSFEIGEGEGGTYILNANDLCAAPFIDLVLAAGATSLKIEGRSKTFYYVASTTAAYRKALDAAIGAAARNEEFLCPSFTLDELTRTSHRPYSTGFFINKEGATQSTKQSGYIREWQLIGEVERVENGVLHCSQRGKFVLGEPLEVLTPAGQAYAFTPQWIHNKDNEPVESTAQSRMLFSLQAPEGVDIPPMSILRKKL